jgi:hypothetical protein
LLHELVPTAATVGLLMNPTGAISEPESKDAEAAARTLGLPVYVQTATSEREIDAAFASFDQPPAVNRAACPHRGAGCLRPPPTISWSTPARCAQRRAGGSF